MSALQLYAVAAPAVALAFVGALGLFLFRRDVATFSLAHADASRTPSPGEETMETKIDLHPAGPPREEGTNRNATAVMTNLAQAIQGLTAHMRIEQQMMREWADGQGEQNREIKKLLERIEAAREELSKVR